MKPPICAGTNRNGEISLTHVRSWTLWTLDLINYAFAAEV